GVNTWLLQRFSGTSQAYTSETKNEIKVTIDFTYGETKDGKKGSVDLHFARGMVGGQERWKFKEAKGLDWKSPLPDFIEKPLRNGLANRIESVYQNFIVDGRMVYDQRQVVDDLAKKVEDSLRAAGLFTGESLTISGVSALDGGGLRLRLVTSFPKALEL